MLEIQTLHTLDTEYSADSIEWCPDSNNQNIFACGTYQLEETKDESSATPEKCQRKGRIYLFQFNKDTKALKELQRIETAAILDMKWLAHENNRPILATATALGKIEIFLLENKKLNLIESTEINPEQKNMLALSLDWGLAPNNHIVTSDSKGDISLFSFSNERKLNVLRSWQAHDFEAWICAFDKWDVNRIYTGGDDCLMLTYDLRTNSKVSVNKSHTAGVTCLLSHRQREHILLTGSYDENLRIFDTRSMKQPMSEMNLQGGIWRLKAHSMNSDLILSACMYHNFSIVKIADLLAPALVGTFVEHKSICYGSDWCLDVNEKDESYFMATCSFYDHKLCVSEVERI